MLDMQPTILMAIIFLASIAIAVGAEGIKIIASWNGNSLDEEVITKAQTAIVILGALLSFSAFVRSYLTKIYDLVFTIQDKMLMEGDFGINTRDEIYSMMTDSFKNSVKSNHEICVTSFVKHDPTVISDAMKDYHDATKPFISSGEALVKRIIVVEDINKLRWIEKQIKDYAVELSDEPVIEEKSQDQSITQEAKGEPIKAKTRISLRILTPELKYGNQWLMPINLELFGGEDVFIINPTMRGNETPSDVCSYFLGNKENYSIYRGLFQNMWVASEPVIENGFLATNSYRRIKHLLLRNFIYSALFDEGQVFPRNDYHIERELDKMDLDPEILRTSEKDGIASPCGVVRQMSLTEVEDSFAISIQWWPSLKSEQAFKLDINQDFWVKTIIGDMRLLSESGKQILSVSKGRAKFVKAQRGVAIKRSGLKSAILIILYRRTPGDNENGGFPLELS